jgi:Zn-dependent oligopeptidase
MYSRLFNKEQDICYIDTLSSADDAFHVLAKYIQEINMDENIYNVLKSLTDNEFIFQACTEEERLFVVDMKLEFERGGVHLKGSARERSVVLHDEVSQNQSLYMQNLMDSNETFEITELIPEHKSQLKHWLEHVKILVLYCLLIYLCYF